ncbi:SPX domain [Sesbania bispinosa]|nr:SPX domain [Sesbania bispinosa]
MANARKKRNVITALTDEDDRTVEHQAGLCDVAKGSTCPRGGEELTVADFIDASRGHWKVDMIRSFFSAADVNRILSIHLSRLDREDSLIWKLSKDGRYSVKSAYYHITENMVDNSHYKVQGDWKTLWKLKVPNCVKLFLWRLLRGCLPTRMNLQRKGVSCPATCAFCESALENEWHVFFGCMNSIVCWQKAGMWQLLEQPVSVSEGFQETAFFLLSSLQYNMKHKFAMVLWSLWKQRNEKVWEGVQRATSKVVTRAQEAFTDWNCVKSCDQNGFGVGLCLRDDKGQYIKSKVLYHHGSPPPREAEALGLLDALSWLGELGMLEIEQTLPDWRDQFLSYKDLKKQLKLIAPKDPSSERRRSDEGEVTKEVNDFLRLLELEIEKFNAFFVEKEEEYVITWKELQDKVAWAKNSDVELMSVGREIVDLHGEMVLLENYSALNYTGLVKIIKKYDKRTGALLRLPFIQDVLNQPFFKIDVLNKLVKECEMMLSIIFPKSGPLGPSLSTSEDFDEDACGSMTGNENRETLEQVPKELAEIQNMENMFIKLTTSALHTLKEIRGGSSTVSIYSLPPLHNEAMVED